MPDGKDYISKAYQAVRETVSGFDKSEAQFRQLITTDTNYRNKVYAALKDNIDGFIKTPEEFSGLIVPKQPPVDPAVQQRMQQVTTYLQNKQNRPAQDVMQLPVTVTQAPDVLRTELKKEEQTATFEKVKKGFREQKLPVKKENLFAPKSGVDVATGLQAKYGTDWINKATPQEKNEYNLADARQRQETRQYYERMGGETVSAPTPQELIESEERQKLQRDADEFYNSALGKLYWNVLKPVGGTAEKIVGSTIAAGIRTAGDITGTDEITDGIADYISTALNPDEWTKDRVTRITPTALKGGLFNNGKINTSLIVPKLAETLTTMFAITQGGGGSPGLFARSFLIQEEDYRRDGAAAGLKGDDLDTYAYLGATITSALEPLSPNKLIDGQVKRKAAKEFFDAIASGFSKQAAMKIAAKTLVKESALENTQEFSQLIADKTLRYFTDKMSGKPTFNDDLSWQGMKDEIYETLFLTTGATMLLSSPKALRDTKPTNLEKSSWYNAALNPDKFTSFINKRVEAGELTPEDATQINENFNKYKSAVEQSQQLGFGADQTIDIAFNIYKGEDISEQLKQIKDNPVLKEAVGAPLKQEQQEIAADIKRIGMGVPEVGTEITGTELINIVENIGDKGGDATALQDKVKDGNYRVEEINVKELYNNNPAFKQYVDEYSSKVKDETGLLVPAILDEAGAIVDGRSRLAQQYIDGKETVQVFKQLKTEGYEQGIGSAEDARIETRQSTEGEGAGTEREGATTQTDDRNRPFSSQKNEVAEEIRQAIRDGKFKGLPVETAESASDADLVDFIYDQATQTTPDPETGEPTTARPLLDKTFGSELIDRVIASKGQVEQPRVTVSPTESYESFLNEMMDFVSIVKDGSFEYRLNIPNMAQKERDGAIKDIRAGKSSKRRSDFEAAVKSMWENKSVDVNRGKGAQSESTSIPFDDYFNQQDEDAADNEIMGTWIVPETEGWFDEEITNLNTENETGSNEQDAEGRSEQPEPETEVRGADATETGRVIDRPSSQDRGQAQEPPSEVTPPPETEGFERKPGKKSLLNRAYEGTTDAALKERIAEFGLDYERQTWDDARAISKQIIEQLGIESALDAVRKGMVKGAEAAFIWSEAIDAVGDEIATTTDPDALSKLQQYEAELLDEFDRTARNDGRFLSALQDIYKNSDFQYQLSRQIEEYKQRNKGEIPDDVRVKFEQLSKELEDVNKKLAAKEEELRVAQEKQAMEDIKEAVAREKPERKKSNKQKAKQVADAIRKGKIQRHGVFLSSSPASAVWDAALEATAKAIEAGGAVADAIKAGVAVIKQSDWYKSLVKGQQGEAEQTFTDYINETAAKEKPKPSIVNGKIQIPHELIRNLVESGIDNINDLTTAVLEELKADFPNITERQVRDAITNYGRVINPNREEVEVDIRKIKRVGRVLSALEDIAEKKRPLRSGLQRDKLDAEERVLQKELREALKTLPPDEAEEGRKLKTTLDGIKSRLKNQIEDIEREIATGEKRVAGKAEVEYDAEAKALREQRDELKRVRDEIFGDEITDEQRIQRAIRITQRAAEKLEEKIKANDLSAKQRTPVTSPALETERKRLAELREQMKQMRDEAGITEANRLTSAKKRVEKQTEQLRERLRTKYFAKRKRVEQKADNELIKLKAEKLRIQEEFDKEQYKAELKNRDTGTKIADAAIEAWGITRVLQATGELSYIGIQGGMYLRDAILHPIRTAKLIIESFQHFASEKRFKEWERHIKAQPYYPELKASKLALTEYDSKLTAREELGVSGWANRIWDALMLPAKLGSERLYEILKKANPLLKFERAAVSYLNNLRLIKFLEGKKKIESEGKTFQTHPESYKAVADVVNTFTGRASLGKAELIAKQLAIVLYSPRNWASILKQTTPLFFYKLYTWRDKGTFKPSVAQKMAISDYMKYFAFNGSLLLLAAAWANGDDDEETSVSFDPKSSDFLKLKIGDQRIDFLGGRSQMIVFQMRLLFDKKTSASGEEKHLGQDAYTPTRFDLALDLSLNKLAPTASLLTDYLRTGTKGEGEERKRVTRFGEEYSFTEAIKERTHPMFWGTVSEIHKDQPALVEAYMITLAAIGVNIQTQNNKKSIEAIMKEREQTKEAPKKTKAETLKEKREKRIKERELKARAAEEGIKYIKPQ